jgi:hypothetical protein
MALISAPAPKAETNPTTRLEGLRLRAIQAPITRGSAEKAPINMASTTFDMTIPPNMRLADRWKNPANGLTSHNIIRIIVYNLHIIAGLRIDERRKLSIFHSFEKNLETK